VNCDVQGFIRGCSKRATYQDSTITPNVIRQYIYTEGGVLYRNMTFLKTNRRMRRRIRKFADKQRTNRQSSRQTENSSNTEATLILCGWWGERANNRGDKTIKEEDEEKN